LRQKSKLVVKPVSQKELLGRLSGIKLLALDVDGVLTDDSIFFGPNGFEMKKFNISDGLFIVLAMRAGLEIAVVSGRESAATDTRMRDLGVKHVLQGRREKTDMIRPLLDELMIRFEQIAFVGNEILDVNLARRAGVAIAVADSCPELLREADYVTKRRGGEGAVREVVELYFEAKDIDARSLLQ